MVEQRLYWGWVPLVGVPTLFLTAFLVGLFPPILNVPLCGVKLFVGINCPGCGLTRSFVALMHGHLQESIDFHPLGTVIALWMVYMFVRALLRVVRGKPLPSLLSDRVRFFVLNVFVVALLVQWIIGLILK